MFTYVLIRLARKGTYASEAGPSGIASRSVYIVVASWCPHCKNAKPEFDAFVKHQSSEDPSVGVHVIDVVSASDKEKRVAEALGVKGFPTVVFVDSHGKLNVYRGERKAQSMIEYSKRFFEPAR